MLTGRAGTLWVCFIDIRKSTVRVCGPWIFFLSRIMQQEKYREKLGFVAASLSKNRKICHPDE